MIAARSSSAAAPERSVGAVVRAARAGLRAARVLECALFFAAAALLARAAALLSGVEQGAGSVAILCGALAAASWWLEHPSPLSAAARALDDSLHHRGALTLALELEERRGARGLGAMEELVRARVLARLRLGEAVRALSPSFFLPLAAPAVAGLVFLLVQDLRAAPASAGDLESLSAGLARALGAVPEGEVTGSAPESASGAGPELRELQALLEQAAVPDSPARTRAAKEARVRLDVLDRRLAERAASATPALRPRLAEARVWIDALRAALGEPAAMPPSLAESPAAPAGAAGDGTGPGNLTGAPPDGTISRPMAEPAPTTLAPGAPSDPALGLQRGSHWPAEYDAVVERWVELSRAARAGARR